MPALQFSVLIDAPREDVWRTLLYSPGHECWAATFSVGSRCIGSWAPFFENHTFTDDAGGTRVQIDVFGAFGDWMSVTWPKPLLALRSFCETPA